MTAEKANTVGNNISFHTGYLSSSFDVIASCWLRRQPNKISLRHMLCTFRERKYGPIIVDAVHA